VTGQTDIPFIDPISGQECALVITYERTGIKHPECSQLADISLDLDAFFCLECGWNGRVSGAWVYSEKRKIKRDE